VAENGRGLEHLRKETKRIRGLIETSLERIERRIVLSWIRMPCRRSQKLKPTRSRRSKRRAGLLFRWLFWANTATGSRSRAIGRLRTVALEEPALL